jgi:tetratricopeptide (TPR) repeat protein
MSFYEAPDFVGTADFKKQVDMTLFNDRSLQTQVNGLIFDNQSSEPLFGGNVFVSGTSWGATSDPDGNYKLDVAPGTYTLNYSYIGFEPVDVLVDVKEGDQLNLNVRLDNALVLIDEVTIASTESKDASNKGVKNKLSETESVEVTDISVTGARSGEDNRYYVGYLMEQAMAKYEAGEFAEASELFDQILKQDPQNQDALFYGAVSFLSLEKANKAINNLEKLQEIMPQTYEQDAQWYLSLAYLKKKKKAEAEKLLNEIIENEGHYMQRAKEALDDLD